MDIIKQSVGIDISKASFDACICQKHINQSYTFSKVRKFKNDKSGFNLFLKWVKKNANSELSVHFALEATGTYHELLSYHLYKLKKQISVVLPNKVKYFAKSLNVKGKTDPIDAKNISMMCSDRALRKWEPPSDLFRELRSICRLYESLQSDKTQQSNRFKQLEISYNPLKKAIQIHRNNIKRIEKQLSQLEKDMECILRSDEKIYDKVKNLLSIKGIGMKTIAIVLGETQGFQLINNQRQLVSFCGLDVVQHQSGSSIKGKTRISKKGNSHIRSALFFPAMSARRYNPGMAKFFDRVTKNKKKKVGITAIQRKLLVLMYSLWKNNLPFIENYEQIQNSGIHELEGPSSLSTQRVESVY